MALTKRERDRRYRERNGDIERTRKRRWETANAEHVRTASREAKRRVRAADPEAAKALARKQNQRYAESKRRYSERNRERESERARRWARENPSRANSHGQTRRARRAAAFVEHVDHDVVLQRDCGICGICGFAVGPDWHLDHVKPLSKGGEHSYANVQVTHPKCNLRKGVRSRI